MKAIQENDRSGIEIKQTENGQFFKELDEHFELW